MYSRCISIFCLTATVFIFFFGCSSKVDEALVPSDYANKVVIVIRLGPSTNLTKIDKDDIFITVLNKGDKTIKELRGDVLFMDADGNEAGKIKWIFVWENKGMGDIAVGTKKLKFKPLEPGKSFDTSHDVVKFFEGKDRAVQRKLEYKWDGATTEVKITKLILE